ncbi:hypothetical protein [Pseudovibrio sp. SCP19]|uniref:hypothetical protein n=1 Tax=Pseudovibrio sp. SCP19 TaxID=3141374 RepID=UPI00333785C5
MTDKAHPSQKNATTTGMKAKGFYNKNSAPQQATIAYVYPWLHEAVGNLPMPTNGSPLRFVDYGCSEGANSIQIMAQLTEATRQHGTNPVQTIHSDLPSNDYTTLLHTIGNRTQPPYTDPSVFGSIVGGSMFNQLLPPGSVHLATSFNATVFLSERPLERLPDYVMPNGPSLSDERGSISAKDKEVCEKQAAHDLETFLKARANELAPGGKLMLQTVGRNEHVSTADGIVNLFNLSLLDHVADGSISQDTYERYYHPVYIRSLEQLTAPVKPGSGSLSHLFNIDKAECYETPVPFVEQYKQDNDASAYARQIVNFYRAFTEAPLRAALSHLPNTTELLDSIYARGEHRVREAPHLYDFHFISVAMLLTRTENG